MAYWITLFPGRLGSAVTGQPIRREQTRGLRSGESRVMIDELTARGGVEGLER
jgi:hypothetical protein